MVCTVSLRLLCPCVAVQVPLSCTTASKTHFPRPQSSHSVSFYIQPTRFSIKLSSLVFRVFPRISLKNALELSSFPLPKPVSLLGKRGFWHRHDQEFGWNLVCSLCSRSHGHGLWLVGWSQCQGRGMFQIVTFFISCLYLLAVLLHSFY